MARQTVAEEGQNSPGRHAEGSQVERASVEDGGIRTPPIPDADIYEDFQPNSQVSTTSTQGTSRRLKSHASQTAAWNAPVAKISMTETSGQTYGFSAKDTGSR